MQTPNSLPPRDVKPISHSRPVVKSVAIYTVAATLLTLKVIDLISNFPDTIQSLTSWAWNRIKGPTLKNLLQKVGRGMEFHETISYMTSVLQAVTSISTVAAKIWDDEDLRPQGTTSKTDIVALGEFFRSHGWNPTRRVHSQFDPREFTQYLLKSLSISNHIITRDIVLAQMEMERSRKPVTMQDIVRTSFYPTDLPEVLAIAINGRTENGLVNETPIELSRNLSIPLVGATSTASYSLKAVIVRVGGGDYLNDRGAVMSIMNCHYVTFIAQSDDSWIEYDGPRQQKYSMKVDPKLTQEEQKRQQAEIAAIQAFLERKNYLCLYSKT